MNLLNNTKTFSFLGITSQQQFADLIAWEIFFQRATHFNSMTELGTGRGGMSLYFLLMSHQRHFDFWTYDIEDNAVENTRLAKLVEFQVHFKKMDIFNISSSITSKFVHPMILYCDNGDKPKEVREYYPYLFKNDCLAVHDYGIEISGEDIPYGFMPFLTEECQELNSITRFFIKL